MRADKPDILIVDDDSSVRDALRGYLIAANLSVRTANGAAEMDACLDERIPDAVILDVMMPGEDGLSICRRLNPRVPVLMLSAAGETIDRIVGLELGASDYLAKPFDPRELLARLRSILRRPQVPETKSNAQTFLGWKLLESERSLLNPNEEVVPLTTGEFSLLLAFVERSGRILSREQILELTHGPLAANFDRAVDLAVSRLRKKLDWPLQAPVIETVRGVGYRFLPKVSSA